MSKVLNVFNVKCMPKPVVDALERQYDREFEDDGKYPFTWKVGSVREPLTYEEGFVDGYLYTRGMCFGDTVLFVNEHTEFAWST